MGREIHWMDPKLKLCDAHEVQVRSKVAGLGTFWRQLHTKLANGDTMHENTCFDDFVLGRQCPNVPVLSIWSSTWVDIAPKCVRVRAKLRHVGPELGRGLNQMGPSGAEVGACCGHVEPNLWQICPFVSLAAKLPRPGTFGVGGFRD
jgi:hypothetical protein